MDESAVQLRNLKDFLSIYNRMTENCFKRCAFDMNLRTLNNEESACVESCASKFIATNHRVMGIYVQVQADLVTKRIKEAEAAETAQLTSTETAVVEQKS